MFQAWTFSKQHVKPILLVLSLKCDFSPKHCSWKFGTARNNLLSGAVATLSTPPLRNVGFFQAHWVCGLNKFILFNKIFGLCRHVWLSTSVLTCCSFGILFPLLALAFLYTHLSKSVQLTERWKWGGGELQIYRNFYTLKSYIWFDLASVPVKDT